MDLKARDYHVTTPADGLLTQWLNSLETRSLFWLHYIDDDDKRANSLESTEASTSEDTDADHMDDYLDADDDIFAPTCRSIAHRESDLLLALTENCTLGPVCYFCR
ncbi:hypothetical protein Zmor_005293 [Zophobas morio]|uniref:Uncharacterized protein n=1 Tax=Zophobas morio TaxID=2755281 RepID=A0AA38MLT2_9CUCU|nr:hypothetical protein Zmor_005293 [Zophobas morio]